MYEILWEELITYYIEKDEDISRTYERMNQQLSVKDRELKSLEDKYLQSKKELKQSNKPKRTENERLQDIEKKIKKNEALSKELIKEIKALKKLSHDNGNELIDLDISEQYPDKIKSLMEEIRWAKDRQNELVEKI